MSWLVGTAVAVVGVATAGIVRFAFLLALWFACSLTVFTSSVLLLLLFFIVAFSCISKNAGCSRTPSAPLFQHYLAFDRLYVIGAKDAQKTKRNRRSVRTCVTLNRAACSTMTNKIQP